MPYERFCNYFNIGIEAQLYTWLIGRFPNAEMLIFINQEMSVITLDYPTLEMATQPTWPPSQHCLGTNGVTKKTLCNFPRYSFFARPSCHFYASCKFVRFTQFWDLFNSSWFALSRMSPTWWSSLWSLFFATRSAFKCSTAIIKVYNSRI